MKTLKSLFALTLLSLSNLSFAQCYGTDSYQTCYDNNTGNQYNISRYGNTTQVDGYNANTGSSWSQTSNTYGNTTYQNGYDSNGNNWNQTIQNYGNSTTYSGIDSQGNSFYKTCTTNYDGSKNCY